MTERPADIKVRLDTVDQLEAVITAMRSIAAARARQARERLDGIRAYAQTIGTAIGGALAFLPDHLATASAAAPATTSTAQYSADIMIVLAAEQGFAGAFSEQVLDVAASRLAGAELLLVGDRGRMVAAERGQPVAWSAPMAAHIGDVPALANRIAAALYLRLASGRARHVSLIHAEPGPADTLTLTERSLLPFDFDRFPGGSRALPPLVTLPPARLLEQLAEEYVFAELCAALMLSFAAENEARMRAMIGARSNVMRTRDMLRATYRRLRQEQITTEIVELAAGRMAQGDDGKGSRLNPS
jgi:F-type H+-transporting ATPase subunit gamma